MQWVLLVRLNPRATTATPHHVPPVHVGFIERLCKRFIYMRLRSNLSANSLPSTCYLLHMSRIKAESTKGIGVGHTHKHTIILVHSYPHTHIFTSIYRQSPLRMLTNPRTQTCSTPPAQPSPWPRSPLRGQDNLPVKIYCPLLVSLMVSNDPHHASRSTPIHL